MSDSSKNYQIFISHSSKDRDFAWDLSVNLEREGFNCWIAPRDIPAGRKYELAIMEHNRWVEERLSNGWVFGPEKNTDLRISPYLTSWENIPESIREYDRQAVRNIIPILETAGLHVLM